MLRGALRRVPPLGALLNDSRSGRDMGDTEGRGSFCHYCVGVGGTLQLLNAEADSKILKPKDSSLEMAEGHPND